MLYKLASIIRKNKTLQYRSTGATEGHGERGGGWGVVRANFLRKGHFIWDRNWLAVLVKEGSTEVCSRQRPSPVSPVESITALGRTVNSVGLEWKGPRTWLGRQQAAKPKQALLLDSDFALGATEGHFTSGYQGSILISVKTESYKSLFKKEKFEMRYEPPFMKRISFD